MDEIRRNNGGYTNPQDWNKMRGSGIVTDGTNEFGLKYTGINVLMLARWNLKSKIKFSKKR